MSFPLAWWAETAAHHAKQLQLGHSTLQSDMPSQCSSQIGVLCFVASICLCIGSGHAWGPAACQRPVAALHKKSQTPYLTITEHCFSECAPLPQPWCCQQQHLSTEKKLLHRDQAATLQTDGRNEGVQRKDKGRQSSKPHTSAQKLTLLLRRKWTDYVGWLSLCKIQPSHPSPQGQGCINVPASTSRAVLHPA